MSEPFSGWERAAQEAQRNSVMSLPAGVLQAQYEHLAEENRRLRARVAELEWELKKARGEITTTSYLPTG